MIIFIFTSLLAVALFAAFIKDYCQLKRHFSESDHEKQQSLTFVDVLFNPQLRDDSAARKLQKRAISLFCAALMLVNLASYAFAKM